MYEAIIGLSDVGTTNNLRRLSIPARKGDVAAISYNNLKTTYYLIFIYSAGS